MVLFGDPGFRFNDLSVFTSMFDPVRIYIYDLCPSPINTVEFFLWWINYISLALHLSI